MQARSVQAKILLALIAISLFSLLIWTFLSRESDVVSGQETFDREQTNQQGIQKISRSTDYVDSDSDAESQEQTRMVIDSYTQFSKYLVWLLIALSIATIVSVGISFYLYRWRGLLLANNKMAVVPEEWAKHLMNVGIELTNFGIQVSSQIERITAETAANSEKLVNMTNTYMELQLALDEKDLEIKRLKAGYDAEIFRKYIKRFASIEFELDEFILEDADDQKLQILKRLFSNAFQECGVSRFEPVIGDDYRSAFGVADNPKKVSTDDPEKNFRIAQVDEAGFKLDAAESNAVVIQSKVKIYKYEEQGAI